MESNYRVWGGFEEKGDNKGFVRFLKIQRGSIGINKTRVKAEARFDEKYVLTTNKQVDLAFR